MIDYVKGKVVQVESESIVIDVRDIGYRVYTPNPYAFAAGDEPVTVYTHHHVREDAALLFGFATRDEQRFFRKLLDVSGIGPRVALGVLAGARPDAIIAAIGQDNVNFLTKLPGIGRKTAQRMILDLKDKLDGLLPAGAAAAAGWETDGALARDSGQGAGTSWPEAREALASLGYTAAELDRAWNGLQGSITGDETVDTLMKRALQQLFKG